MGGNDKTTNENVEVLKKFSENVIKKVISQECVVECIYARIFIKLMFATIVCICSFTD